MYTIYIEQPLHNLFLWLVNITPGNTLFLGLALLALFVKALVFLLVYHGHVNNIKHHYIRGHVDKLHKKHKDNKSKFEDELHKIYEHYSFNPFKGVFIVLIQFIIFFAILTFLYSGVGTGFNRLDLVTMDNVFVASAMDVYFAGTNLLYPITLGWLLLLVGIVQFLSLEIYLLTKRKVHRHPSHEEKIEHILNLVISIGIVLMLTQLPGVFAVYWFFYMLFGIIRKLFFDAYIDKNIVKKLKEVTLKIEKEEEPKVRKLDRTFLFVLWKIFHPKSDDKKFYKLIRSMEKGVYSLHHFTYLQYSQKKIYEEPYTVALIVFFFLLLLISLFGI